MGKPTRSVIAGHCRKMLKSVVIFIKRHIIALALMSSLTALFFAPIIVQLGSYSPGGDAMFNAYVLARNHSCILRQNCPDYTDANIFFPNKDTMLYSETELSAGAVSLPLALINDNPIFAYNIMTIASFFMAGFAMYLLAMHLSGGNKYISILAGLLFEFAPIKIHGIFHLQNLSIFCLPLAILFILKYLKSPSRKYLVGLFLSLLYVFYASWVQMVFVLAVVGIMLAGLAILKLERLKSLLPIGLIVVVATLFTLPLAKEYIQFSKKSGATFSTKAQVEYSASLVDYVKPQDHTLLGTIYYHILPGSVKNAYNPDSISYHSFTGYTLAILAITLIAYYYFKYRKVKVALEYLRQLKYAALFVTIGLAGFLASLGPLLKIRADYLYGFIDGISAGIILPYALITKFLPQLAFIRAVGRFSVIMLFAICCLIALLSLVLGRLKLSIFRTRLLYGLVTVLLLIEVMPLGFVPMSKHAEAYNLTIPPVYKFIKEQARVDNLVIIASDYDYNYDLGLSGFTKSEQTMWSGYHNKNIVNGYSGYMPPDYVRSTEDYNEFYPNDITKLKQIDVRFVLVDKLLCKNHPDLPGRVESILGEKLYTDSRYDLYSLEGK